MLLDVEYFETFSKNSKYCNEYGFISKFFALNWSIIVALTNKKKCCFHYNEDLNKILLAILKNSWNILLLLFFACHVILILVLDI